MSHVGGRNWHNVQWVRKMYWQIKNLLSFGGYRVFDKVTNTQRVIKRGTYEASTLLANIVVAGVVFGRVGSKVMVAAKDAAVSSGQSLIR